MFSRSGEIVCALTSYGEFGGAEGVVFGLLHTLIRKIVCVFFEKYAELARVAGTCFFVAHGIDAYCWLCSEKIPRESNECADDDCVCDCSVCADGVELDDGLLLCCSAGCDVCVPYELWLARSRSLFNVLILLQESRDGFGDW